MGVFSCIVEIFFFFLGNKIFLPFKTLCFSLGERVFINIMHDLNFSFKIISYYISSDHIWNDEFDIKIASSGHAWLLLNVQLVLFYMNTQNHLKLFFHSVKPWFFANIVLFLGLITDAELLSVTVVELLIIRPTIFVVHAGGLIN